MVGQRIARARHDHGLSIDDVAAATSLRPLIIEAIESDDYAMSGGDVYVIGHLRIIAKAVGLDSDEIIAQYRASSREPD
jgi:cytoskeletal protein RodZ